MAGRWWVANGCGISWTIISQVENVLHLAEGVVVSGLVEEGKQTWTEDVVGTHFHGLILVEVTLGMPFRGLVAWWGVIVTNQAHPV